MEMRVNGETRQVDVPSSKPLLWVLREDLSKVGTKFGCGYGACGACTVLVDDQPVRSCVYPVSAAAGKDVTTIEGLSDNVGDALKKAWEDQQVPQCGYCQPGMIMACAGAVKSSDGIPEADMVLQKMTNLCRCGTYHEIRKAVAQGLDDLKAGGAT